ncbi:hypothetical protein GCM10010406_52770 [Streptomyces thermolineatus]|uniref:Uncharacterized protein n=1 Tax=Streptomyces thermolineatus TaxID=44033 RepID=A0ABN3MWF1_9ACTN
MTSRSAETEKGWRIERIPGRDARRDADGSIRLPLWLVRNGRHVCDGELRMSPAEAEVLHAQLTRLLEPVEVPGDSAGLERLRLR